MGLRKRSTYEKYGRAFFVTTSTVKLKPFFTSKEHYDILISSLKFLLKKYSSQLIAYVLMPNHLHLIIYFEENPRVSDFMRDFKKFTCFEFRKLCESRKNLKILGSLRRNATNFLDQKFKLWEDRFDSLVVTNEKTLMTKIHYIHFNPQKRRLVESFVEWPYSSARNYFRDDNSLIEVDKNFLGVRR